jgi:hypothetical protein
MKIGSSSSFAGLRHIVPIRDSGVYATRDCSDASIHGNVTCSRSFYTRYFPYKMSKAVGCQSAEDASKVSVAWITPGHEIPTSAGYKIPTSKALLLVTHLTQPF